MLAWLRAAIFLFSVQRVKNFQSPLVCVNISCLTCDTKPSKVFRGQPDDSCSLCSNVTVEDGAAKICFHEIPTSCKKDLLVSQNISTMSLSVGQSTNLSCNYTETPEPTAFRWYKDDTLLPSTNTSQLSLNSVNQSAGGNYCCIYENVCGNYSSECVQITLGSNGNEMLVLIVCILAAVVFLFLFTCGAKWFLKRDIAKARHMHKEQSPVTEVSTF
ncbi:uncharacterized protein LOC125750629 [Brienomyrus brachyistius]|uniref:uncharacterized protein LOC125750629 n=1 Tax=Brienomyrus brachyistius TaxID=42636 RepID=UPI0020B33849|nr:uncharacterized protein LOC125750629 [Brienomyrus brachyistius]